MSYAVFNGTREMLVKFMSMNSISQITNSAAWFLRSCVARHREIPWYVFLAYDTDGHNAPISQFHEGDWKVLREEIGGSARMVVNLAAEADIEDVMLLDPSGVLSFLGLPPDTEVPRGGKGKSKMKALHRMASVRRAYHEGTKARSLIRSLDMEAIAARSPIPFSAIDGVIWPAASPEGRPNPSIDGHCVTSPP
ncbi:hypothetical protein NW198_09525 [Thermophilibacter sp. ET337]|uniref:hypothetical protein n=1 Tax=Thermophilibacter sp. ET337 TaxID=2973084 RepID=UPI0021ABD450|nr:hypothetical protein [Thermophilibacter sp. ET337]MCR8908843.1 hypothetical protein [Thermophilibacter sp. ET337]